MEANGGPTAGSSQKAARMGRIGRCCGRNARLTRVSFACSPAVSPTANPVGGNKEVPNTMYVPATLAQPAAALTPRRDRCERCDTVAAGAGAHLAERVPRRAERARGPHDERHRQADGAHAGPASSEPWPTATTASAPHPRRPRATRRRRGAGGAAAGARRSRLEDAGPHAHRRERSLSAALHAARDRERAGAAAVRRRRRRSRRAPAARRA